MCNPHFSDPDKKCECKLNTLNNQHTIHQTSSKLRTFNIQRMILQAASYGQKFLGVKILYQKSISTSGPFSMH